MLTLYSGNQLEYISIKKQLKSSLFIELNASIVTIPTWAHNDPNDLGWRSGQIRILSTKEINTSYLRQYKDPARPICDNPDNGVATYSYGQFNDDVDIARTVISGMRNQLTSVRYLGLVAPICRDPDSINSKDHHRSYSIDQGVTFDCGQCIYAEPVVPMPFGNGR